MTIITHNYPTKNNPMAGCFIEQHAMRVKNARVVHIPFGLLTWPYHLFRAMIRLRDVEPGEAVICHWWIPYGWLCAFWFKDRTKVICHGTDVRVLDRHRWLAWLLRPFAYRVGRWQCVSQYLKDRLLDIYPRIQDSDVLVEPMPLSPVFTIDQQLRENLVVFAGFLTEKKRPRLALKWLRDNSDRELKLVFCGSGPEEPKLRNLSQDWGISDRVSFRGRVDQSGLARIFNSARYYISTSEFEGYGLTLREAKACGCLIVSYIGDGRTEEDVDIVLGDLQRGG